jgi:hypothetical protein
MPFVASRALGYSPFKIDKSWGLRDLPADIEVFMPCKTVACDSCGGIFLDIRFNDSQTQSLYQDYRTTSYNEMRSKYEPHYSSQYQDLDISESYIREKESFILNHCDLRD